MFGPHSRLLLTGAFLILHTPAIAGSDTQATHPGGRAILKGTVNAQVPEDDPMQTTSSVVSLGNGRLVAVYYDRAQVAGTGSTTGYSYSNDNGKTWIDGGVLHSQPFPAEYPPAISAFPAQNIVYVASSGIGEGSVAIRKSLDGGKTWSPAVDASNGLGQTTYQQIAVDTHDGSGKGNVYVCFTAAPGQVAIVRSTDGGQSFAPAGGLALAAPVISPCAVAVGPNHHVYVFYVEDEGGGNHFLFMRKSADRGLTYAAPVKVAPVNADAIDEGTTFNSPFFDGILQPQVAFNPDKDKPWIYLTFADIANAAAQGEDVNTYVVYSRNGGNTWSSRKAVDAGTGDQFAPGLAFASPGNLMVGYYSDIDGDESIRYVYHRRARIGKLRSDGSIKFNPSFQLGPNTPWVFSMLGYVTVSYFDAMAGRAGKWFTTWADSRNPNSTWQNQPDIHFAAIDASNAATDLKVNLTTNKSSLLPLDKAKVTAKVTATNSPATDAFLNLNALQGLRISSAFGADCWDHTVTNNIGNHEFSTLGCALGTIAKGKSRTVTLQIESGAQDYGDFELDARVSTSRRDSRQTNNQASKTLEVQSPNSSAVLSSGNLSQVISSGAGPVEVPIIVNTVGTVLRVTAGVRLNHEADADLDISLIDPQGNEVELSSDNGGTGDNFGSGSNDCLGTPTSFGDFASINIIDGTPPFAGDFHPEGKLSDFIGNAMAGTWKLRVVDDAAINSGILGCFRLTIAYK